MSDSSFVPEGSSYVASGESIVFARPRRGRPPAKVAPSLFQHSVEPGTGDTVVVRFHGSIDANSALAFREAVFTAMGRCSKTLLCDLCQIVHVDTSGISHLITVARVASLTGVKLEFQLSPTLEALFSDTGLSRLLRPEPLRGDQIARRLLDPPG
ncbi:MAG: STAS domain-containing protein [Armatimonadaceae bacterium]|jgi:anti-anti-sigma factor